MRRFGLFPCLALAVLAAAAAPAEVRRDSDGDVISVIKPGDYTIRHHGGVILYYFRGVAIPVEYMSGGPTADGAGSGGVSAPHTVTVGGSVYRVEPARDGSVVVQDIATGRRYAAESRLRRAATGKRINPTSYSLD